MKNDSFIKDAISLCIITLIAGFLLGAVYQITKDPIAAAQAKSTQEAYKKVFASAESFQDNELDTAKISESSDIISSLGYGNVLIDGTVEAIDSSGNVIGHVISATSKDGFGGNIQLSVGISSDGTVNGIAFLSISESAGMGMNATQPKFYEQFANKKVQEFTVTKSGSTSDSEIDAISGSTITSKAVTSAVNAAIYFANDILD